jgi:hypothetical protein
MPLNSVKDALLIINTSISIFMIIIHLKNSKLQRKTYLLNSNNSRVSTTNLDFIDCKQFDDNFVIKLAFYNPSSTAAIIKSLTVTKSIPHPNYFLRKLSFLKETEVDYDWSPALDEQNYEVSYLRDAYHLLHVKTVASLYVSVKGCIDRSRYNFEIKTNHNYQKLSCNINGFNHGFPTKFQEWHRH